MSGVAAQTAPSRRRTLRLSPCRQLQIFVFIVLAHWLEHLMQAFEIYVLGMAVPDARGGLGLVWPWLVTTETMHYGYAVVMLVGLIYLRGLFDAPARTWWNVAIGLQIWHHFEHLLLLGQAISGQTLFGAAKPTSIIQLIIPRVELHLFYNGLVFTPMVIAMYLRHEQSRRGRRRAARPASQPAARQAPSGGAVAAPPQTIRTSRSGARRSTVPSTTGRDMSEKAKSGAA